jgi:hypothetical protein
MNRRLTVTQEEILATMRRIGEPVRFADVLQDLRERVAAGAAHQATSRDMRDVLEDWGGLEEMGRIRRTRGGSTLWEMTPRVEIVDDDEPCVQTSEES